MSICGLLSYSLPLSDDSSRAWRIAWDPLFFEYCQAVGGRLRFDLSAYRLLDPASRRLLLLLTKVFWRRKASPWFDLRELAGTGTGDCRYATDKETQGKRSSAAPKHSPEQGVIQMDKNSNLFHRRRPGVFAVQFQRGHEVREAGTVRERPALSRRSASRSPRLDSTRHQFNKVLNRFPTLPGANLVRCDTCCPGTQGESIFQEEPGSVPGRQLEGGQARRKNSA